jgi:hypothetical protein
MRLIFVPLCALALLSACTTATGWHDLTGKDRYSDEAQSDLDACRAATHFPTGDAPITNDALDDAMVGLRFCMKDRGWEPSP